MSLADGVAAEADPRRRSERRAPDQAVGGLRDRVTSAPAVANKNLEEAVLDELPALMARYQAGEEAAFAELYGRLASGVRGYLRTLAPPGTEVDDLVQGTFLQIHLSRRSYLPGAPVRPWVFAIARHVGLMARRAAGRRARREVQPAHELAELPVPARAAGAIDRIALARALGSIPAEGREALWLHQIEGLSFREVAAVQGIRETAAKVRAHRALARLRAQLAGER